MKNNGQETIKEFLNYIQKERGYSSHTVLAYQHDLNTFMDFLEHYNHQFIADLSLIDRQTIRHYLGREFEKGNSSKTVSRRLATIKSLFRYLVEAEVVTDNPAIHVDRWWADWEEIAVNESITQKIFLDNAKRVLGIDDWPESK